MVRWITQPRRSQRFFHRGRGRVFRDLLLDEARVGALWRHQMVVLWSAAAWPAATTRAAAGRGAEGVVESTARGERGARGALVSLGGADARAWRSARA